MLKMEYGSDFEWNPYPLPQTINYNNSLLSNASLFRSGRDALREIAQYYKSSCDRILLPSLCCESMILPFVEQEYSIAYYKMNNNYTPNETDLINKLTNSSIVIYMRYFGLPGISEHCRKLLRANFPTAKLVEDRTHDLLFPRERENYPPDDTIASVRKWFAIPDGGLLWTTRNVSHMVDDCSFSLKRKQSMIQKYEYLKFGNPQLKLSFRHGFSEANLLLDINSTPITMCRESAGILSAIDLPQIYDARKQNIRTLKDHLYHLISKGIIRLITENLELSGLYFPILIERRDEVQKRMSENSIYCPIIWPIPKAAADICQNAKYLSDHMLALPCDQRYGPNDMIKISTALIAVISSVIEKEGQYE